MFKFEGDGYYVKSSEEMRKLFTEEEYPGACDNTLQIAERVDYSFESGKYYLPAFPLEDPNLTVEEYLKNLVYEGAVSAYPAVVHVCFKIR